MFRSKTSRSMAQSPSSDDRKNQSKHVKPQHVLKRAKRKFSKFTRKHSYSSKEKTTTQASRINTDSPTSSNSRPSQGSGEAESPRDGIKTPEPEAQSRSSSLDTIVHNITRHAMVKGYQTKYAASGEYAVSENQIPTYGRTLLDPEISSSPNLINTKTRSADTAVDQHPLKDPVGDNAPDPGASKDGRMPRSNAARSADYDVNRLSVPNARLSDGTPGDTVSGSKLNDKHADSRKKIEKPQKLGSDFPELEVSKQQGIAKKSSTSANSAVAPGEAERSQNVQSLSISVDITEALVEPKDEDLHQTIANLRLELLHCKQDIQDQKAQAQSTISHLRAELNGKASLDKSFKDLQQSYTSYQHALSTKDSETQEAISRLRAELTLSDKQLKGRDSQAARAQSTITSLQNQLASCHEELSSSRAAAQKARDTLSQRALLMQELGALQTANAVVEAKYRNLKTAYQSGQDSCSILGPDTIVLKKVTYNQQRQHLVQLQRGRDEEVVKLKKKLKQTEKLVAEHKSNYVHMCEDRDTWQKSQEDGLKGNEKAFKQLAEKMTDAEAQVRLVGAHESVIRQMRELQKAHGGYQRQYEQLVREREEAIREREVVEEREEELTRKIEEGEEKLRIKGEEVTDLEIQNEVLKTEAGREHEKMEIKMQGLEAIVKGLRKEMDHLKLVGMDERVKEVVDNQAEDLKEMQNAKEASEAEVKNLQASLKLREFHEVDKWVSVAEELKGAGSKNLDEWESDETLNNVNELQSEWSPFKSGLGSVLGVSTFIREQAVREAAEEEANVGKKGSADDWETDSSDN